MKGINHIISVTEFNNIVNSEKPVFIYFGGDPKSIFDKIHNPKSELKRKLEPKKPNFHCVSGPECIASIMTTSMKRAAVPVFAVFQDGRVIAESNNEGHIGRLVKIAQRRRP